MSLDDLLHMDVELTDLPELPWSESGNDSGIDDAKPLSFRLVVTPVSILSFSPYTSSPTIPIVLQRHIV